MSMNNNSMKFLQLAAGAASLTALSGCTKDSSSTECPAGKVPHGKQCVDKCAANKTFASATNTTCVDQCPEGKTFASATNTTCVDKKPEPKKCTKNDQCKDGEECKDGKCQSKCPAKEHFDANEKRCVKDAAADDCQDLWNAAQKVVSNGQAPATMSLKELLSFLSAYKRCFTCMDKDDKASKYVEDVGDTIKKLKKVHNPNLPTIQEDFKTLVKRWSETLTEGEQKKARQDVFAASSTCNGPNEEDFKQWVGYNATKTYLVTTTEAMTEEEYQDLLNNLD